MFADGSGFPPLLERWLRAFLGGPIPAEPRTTCGDCAMLRADPMGARRFEPRTKCCTFFPQLASFEVGGLLLDEDPAIARGRERMRERIAEGLQASPLGVGRPAIFTQIYTPESSFGHAQALRCPYYVDDEGGGCGIWRHREATCATWFCKHERGQLGLTFWNRIHELLKTVEHGLAWAIAVELGIDRDALVAIEPAPFDLSREEEPDHYRGIWGPWAGREIAYYEECARRVAPLAWTDVRARCGAFLDGHVERAREAQRALETRPLPSQLQVAVHERVGSDGTRVRLRTYSNYNPLDVPTAVADAIPRFATASVAEVGLDDATVRQLLDYGVLEI
jgi:hypothetical protein